jgi:hypothetical protein
MGTKTVERQSVEATYISSQHMHSLHRHTITYLHLAVKMEQSPNC